MSSFLQNKLCNYMYTSCLTLSNLFGNYNFQVYLVIFAVIRYVNNTKIIIFYTILAIDILHNNFS